MATRLLLHFVSQQNCGPSKYSENGGFTDGHFYKEQHHHGISEVPSGKRLHNYGKSPFLMGQLTISMAIFNSYVTNFQRV